MNANSNSALDVSILMLIWTISAFNVLVCFGRFMQLKSKQHDDSQYWLIVALIVLVLLFSGVLAIGNAVSEMWFGYRVQ